MFKEFKEFTMRGNVVDMAVGIIVGGTDGTIAKSLVNDISMLPVGLLVGGVDFTNFLKDGVPPRPCAALSDTQTAGAVTINYGIFINSIITFLDIALAVFLLVKSINNLRHKEEAKPATTKNCMYCFSVISYKANRCPQYTSTLPDK